MEGDKGFDAKAGRRAANQAGHGALPSPCPVRRSNKPQLNKSPFSQPALPSRCLSGLTAMLAGRGLRKMAGESWGSGESQECWRSWLVRRR